MSIFSEFAVKLVLNPVPGITLHLYIGQFQIDITHVFVLSSALTKKTHRKVLSPFTSRVD